MSFVLLASRCLTSSRASSLAAISPVVCGALSAPHIEPSGAWSTRYFAATSAPSPSSSTAQAGWVRTREACDDACSHDCATHALTQNNGRQEALRGLLRAGADARPQRNRTPFNVRLSEEMEAVKRRMITLLTEANDQGAVDLLKVRRVDGILLGHTVRSLSTWVEELERLLSHSSSPPQGLMREGIQENEAQKKTGLPSKYRPDGQMLDEYYRALTRSVGSGWERSPQINGRGLQLQPSPLMDP